MDYFQDLTFAEEEIRKIADQKRFPIAGTFELTPLCNMDCKMCYVRMSRQEMEKTGGRLHTAEEWIELGKQAVAQGMMFVLLTGGEPFLYPDFLKVYEALRRMGLIIMINSNGTLLSKEILEGLAQNKPRRVNLSLYGSSDKVYENLCRNPKGFSQVINCVEQLQASNIDIRFSMAITPWNKDDFPNMIAVAEKYGIPSTVSNYIFPAQRRNLTCEEAKLHRFSPEEAGRYGVEISKLYKTPEEFLYSAQKKLYMAKNPKRLPDNQQHGFWCRAGISSCWVTWDWRMLPCGMIQEPYVQMEDFQFGENWDKLKNKMKQILLSSECYNCSKREVCKPCGASMVTETGSYEKKPEYRCKLTEATLETYERIVKELIND